MVNRFVFGCFCLLLSTSSLVSANSSWQPKAEKAAVISAGKARFTVLTNALVRMEFHPQAEFRDAASMVVVNRALSVPEFSHKLVDNTLTIETESLIISYQIDAGAFDANNLRINSVPTQSVQFSWNPGDENPQNLGGTARTLDGMNGGIDWDGNPLDLGQGIMSRAGWFLLDDSDSHNLAQVGEEEAWPWVNGAPDDDYIDWYFFGHGTDYKQALKDYTDVAGKIPLPPKYAFGYW